MKSAKQSTNGLVVVHGLRLKYSGAELIALLENSIAGHLRRRDMWFKQWEQCISKASHICHYDSMQLSADREACRLKVVAGKIDPQFVYLLTFDELHELDTVFDVSREARKLYLQEWAQLEKDDQAKMKDNCFKAGKSS